jgi:hypothetical protein
MVILAVKYQISQIFFANSSGAGISRLRLWQAKTGRGTRTTLAEKRKPLPQNKGFLIVRERSAAEYRSRGNLQIGR